MRTAIRTCPLCEATCGLRLTIDGDQVTRVEGDPDDVLSRGYLCPKGASIAELDADPDRLRSPLVRDGDGMRQASWDEAFGIVADRLPKILDRHGRDAVALYLGNPSVHNLAGQLYLRPLIKALATKNVHSASTVDQMPKHVSSGLMFGDPLVIPVPDIDRTDLLIVLGGDPMTSNGSLWTVPDVPGRLKALRQRGGRLVVVDPRRSRTAAKADLHLAVRPGTDGLLLAAIARTLLADGLADPGDHLRPHLNGLDDLAAVLEPFTLDGVGAVCGLPATAIHQLAVDLATAERAAVYGRIGTTLSRFGTVTSWLVDVCNILTGNLDRPGGAMFPEPAGAPSDRSGRPPFQLGRWASRVSGVSEVLGELPVVVLAEEILTPGDGQVRALITVAGNPVLSTPDGRRLDEALESLDFMVSIDPYVTETSRHADVILPPPTILERSHCDLALTNFSIRNVVNYSPPVFDLPDGRPDEWEILLTLATIALGQPVPTDIAAADAFVAQQVATTVVRNSRLDLTADEALAAVGPRVGPERLLDLVVRAGAHGDRFGTNGGGLTLADLEAHPHGVDLGALEPRIPTTLATASGKIEMLPELLLPEIDRLAAELDGDPPALVLVGRRHLRTNNSWMHNVPSLAKGRDLCTLQVHPDDAKSAGLDDGGTARLRSRVAEVTVTVEITEDIRPGVVSLPHGFGHDRGGVVQEVAVSRPGVSVNDVTDPLMIDPLSGTAAMNGLAVELLPV